METRLKLARFPWIKTLDQFDFEFQPSLDRKGVRELAGLSFVERAHNVVLLGPPGTGKSHVGKALALLAVERGYKVLYREALELIEDITEARELGTLRKYRAQLKTTELLFIDDLRGPFSRIFVRLPTGAKSTPGVGGATHGGDVAERELGA